MAYSSNDYSDIFCQAVSNIIKSEVAKLEFDVSRECIITKINDKAYGKYQVSDGSMSFEAVASEGSYYEVGDHIIVTIPKGDYNTQISILTKVVDEWGTPAGFVRPLDTIVRCTGNLVVGTSDAALAANGATAYINVLSLNDQQLFGFNKIAVSAKFKSLLEDLGLIDGSYGLRFTLTEADGDTLQFFFSSDEMLGNPYAFTAFFDQEYAFDIPEKFNKIVALTVDFYQDSKFKDGNGNYISSFTENLFVEDLEIYFGYSTEKDISEIVKISSDDLAFVDSQAIRNLDLRWFHKIDDYNMEQIDFNKYQQDELYKIRWYRYTPGVSDKLQDKYGGKNWELLNPPKDGNNDLFIDDKPSVAPANYPLSITVNLRGSRTQERFKAICFVKTNPYENDKSYVVWEQYPSNELTFENISEETNGGESGQELLKQGLSLRFNDNSYGNYYIYDQNNTIIDNKEGTAKERVIELVYQNESLSNWNLPFNISKIEWEYPTEIKKDGENDVIISATNSMIAFDPSQHENNKTSSTFTYKIDNFYDVNKSNNTIKCKVYVDDNEQLFATLQEDLRFGKQGSNGTTTTFILEMLDGKNAIIVNEDETDGNYIGLKVQALLINKSGKRIYLSSEEQKNIKWFLINDENETLNVSVQTEADTVLLTLKENIDLTQHYAILKAVYKYNDINLETYLPIAIKNDENVINITGASQVIYNNQGVPKYDNGIYALHIDDLEPITTGWDINTPKDEKDREINPNLFILRDSALGGKALCAAALYSKKITDPIQDRVCVYCKVVNENKEETILWSQPILVMQSQYDYAMLNSWDGKLTINEDNGIILSTMLGAGKKNDQNQFSGVLIGDIKDGTGLQDAEPMTGVYGFQDGIMTYGLKENGSAFFGAYNNGRIEIDGNHGALHSYGWEPIYKEIKDEDGNIVNKWTEWSLKTGVSKGSVFDLDDGQLQLYANPNNYFKYNANNSGILEMALSGINIKLNDKTDNPSLSGYIDATAKGLVTEFRRIAVYAVTCNTVDGTEEKVLNLKDFSKSAFNSDKAEENSVGNLTVDDILQDGLTIAVTFINAETVTIDKIEIKQDVDGEKKVIGYKERRTGKELSLKIEDVSKPIYVNNKATNDTPSLNTSNEVDIDSNPYGWVSGSIIYFTYKGDKDNGYWEVSDSGSYSRITQTADMIKFEVFNIAGTLGSSITQTASNIRTEIREKANYTGTCATNDNTLIKEIKIKDYDKIPNTLSSGFIITVKFDYANTKQSGVQFKLCNLDLSKSRNVINVSDSPKWEAGETLIFMYDGAEFKLTTLSHSSITQLADSINAEVLSTNGTQDTTKGFAWSLTDSDFKLQNYENNQWKDIFICNKNGISINGSGTFSGTIHAGAGGTIADWHIDGYGIYSYSNNANVTGDGVIGCGLWAYNKHQIDGTSVAIHIGANGKNIGGAPFRVYYDGSMYATKGKIGGWTIGSNYLGFYNEGKQDSYFISQAGIYGYNEYVTGYQNHYLYFKNKFMVDTNGKLYAKDVRISGEIHATSGTFKNCTVSGTLTADGSSVINGRLNVGNLYVGEKTILSDYPVKGFIMNNGVIGESTGTNVVIGNSVNKFTGFIIGPNSIQLYVKGQAKEAWN